MHLDSHWKIGKTVSMGYTKAFYVITPYVVASVSNRFYWKYGYFFTLSHILYVIMGSFFYGLMVYSHQRAMHQDPGQVLPHQFKVEGVQYEIEETKDKYVKPNPDLVKWA